MGVREYSTLGGTTGYAFRSISLYHSIKRHQLLDVIQKSSDTGIRQIL